ncbi:MAG: FtsX-like permease family protein [Chloroflexi bacterium]|nr:MAG: FtsX-like permease family protein [Chloroflexota bacterium]TMG40075.1 MAG: FtsX-like permease family protein [Chloroflexota bacterium]
MSFLEGLRLAVGGLTANRLRSALTMLGILIGVAAVIVLVAVGSGASAAVQQQIQGLGSNLLIISSSNARAAGGVSQGFGSGSTLSLADVTALQNKQAAPDVVTAIPSTGGRAQLTYSNQNWNSSLVGTSQDFPEVRNYQLSSGQFFTAADVQAERRVAVVGQTVVTNLFNGQDPVGQSIKINRQTFRVVGVLAAKGGSGFSNQDDTVVVPITSAWSYLLGGRNRNVQQIFAEAASADVTSAANTEITQILLDQHKISDPTQADFQIQTQQDVLASATQTTGILTLMLGAIAGISLVVGGIGIMNIMLVTVTERTREIGIRKAIGARRRDILVQFLIESMFLSGLGGALGILVGTLVSAGMPAVVSSLPTPVVSAPSVLLAFGVSVGIGLFFGIYPANRAARLNPIVALRYE